MFGVKVSLVEPGNFESEIGKTYRKRILAQKLDFNQSRYAEIWKRYYPAIVNPEMEKPERKSADPILVAEAVADAISKEKPKVRYLVVPTAEQGGWTLRQLMKELVQLNEQREHEYDRDTLVKMLDETIALSKKYYDKKEPNPEYAR